MITSVVETQLSYYIFAENWTWIVEFSNTSGSSGGVSEVSLFEALGHAAVMYRIGHVIGNLVGGYSVARIYEENSFSSKYFLCLN